MRFLLFIAAKHYIMYTTPLSDWLSVLSINDVTANDSKRQAIQTGSRHVESPGARSDVRL